jgi:hypothetical protein
MAATASVRISPEAAACISTQASKETKLSAARGDIQFSPRDLGIVMLYLCYDSDDDIRSLARHHILELPVGTLQEIISQDDVHPRVLDLVARCHYLKPELVERLQLHPALAATTAIFLTEKSVTDVSEPAAPSPPIPAVPLQASTQEPPDEEEYDEEAEEHHSKYQLAQTLGVGDKIKLALTGDKEWRSILIKDSNKQVSGAVIKNPRITDGEVLTILKSALQNDEILRVICGNKEWLKNHQIRKALVENNRTPLQTALRLIGTLGDKDLAMLAKSKNVSSVIATQARRQLLQKKRE